MRLIEGEDGDVVLAERKREKNLSTFFESPLCQDEGSTPGQKGSRDDHEAMN